MVDGDAIVEKLNRSDGNSQPHTWPLATYVYAYVCTWYIRESARICCFLHIRTYIPLYPKYGTYVVLISAVLVSKISIFSRQNIYRRISYFSSKHLVFLNIWTFTLKISIYICHEYKMQKQYWYFFSLIAQHWFFEMLRHII